MSAAGPTTLFDVIAAKAKGIVAFHMVSHGMTPEFTVEEQAAIDFGMACGIHAAIEHFRVVTPHEGVES